MTFWTVATYHRFSRLRAVVASLKLNLAALHRRQAAEDQSGKRLAHSKTLLPCASNRMCFGIEDYLVEVESSRRREEQVEILESLRKKKTLHRVGLLFRVDILQRRIAILGAAVLHKIAP